MPKKIDKSLKEEYNGLDDIFTEEVNSSAISDEQSSAPISEDKVSAKTEARRTKGAKSWQRDDFNENPWGRSNILKAVLRDKSFVLRWVNDGGRSKVERALDVGFSFVTYSELENLNKASLRDGVGLDSLVKKRDLCLMKIPRHKALSREKWIESKSIDAKKAKDRFRADAGEDIGILNSEESKRLSIVRTNNVEVPNELSSFV